MAADRPFRTLALATEFKTDKIFIVGSQGILLGMARRADQNDDVAVLAVAPSPEDLIVSKLARLDPKDKEFVEAYHAVRPLDPDVIEDRIQASKFEPAMTERAVAYVRSIARKRGGRST